MKYELVSVVDMWEELKNCSDFDLGKGIDKEGKWLEENKWNEGKRIRDLWSDDDIFESVSMDEFVDDVNSWYRYKEGYDYKGGWYWSSFENKDEMDGEYLERDCDSE